MRGADSGASGDVGHPHMRHYLNDNGVVCGRVNIVGDAGYKGVTARRSETRVRSGGVRIG